MMIRKGGDGNIEFMADLDIKIADISFRRLLSAPELQHVLKPLRRGEQIFHCGRYIPRDRLCMCKRYNQSKNVYDATKKGASRTYRLIVGLWICCRRVIGHRLSFGIR